MAFFSVGTKSKKKKKENHSVTTSHEKINMLLCLVNLFNHEPVNRKRFLCLIMFMMSNLSCWN